MNMFIIIIADLLGVNHDELAAKFQGPESFELEDWYERIDVEAPFSKPEKALIELRRDEFQIPFENRRDFEAIDKDSIKNTIQDIDWGFYGDSFSDEFIASVLPRVKGREASIQLATNLKPLQDKYLKRAKKKDEFLALVAAYNENRSLTFEQIQEFSNRTLLLFDLVSKVSFGSAYQVAQTLTADEVIPQDLIDLMIDSLEMFLSQE